MKKAMLMAAMLAAACSEGEGTTVAEATSRPAPPVQEPVSNGPFGISMGMPLAKLSTEPIEDTPGFYMVTKVPRSHPDIEDVAVQAYPETGVCMVKALGFVSENDNTGSNVKGVADRLATQLSTKYGEGEKHARCVGGLCSHGYGDPTHWAMDIMNGEQVYGYEWDKVPDNAEGVDAIYLAVQSTGMMQPFVVVEYHLKNKAKCEEVRTAQGAGAL